MLVLAAIGVKPGNIPFDVISIIMAVIAAISAMQVAGGLDYLVHQTEKLLRRNPKYITILAPIVTYFLTILLVLATSLWRHCQLSLKLRRNKALNLAVRCLLQWYPRRLRSPHRQSQRQWFTCLP